MFETDQKDEPRCLWCLDKLEDKADLEQFLFGNRKICRDCEDNLHLFEKIVKIDQMSFHILYEKTEPLEDLIKRYVRLGDIACADFFAYDFKHRITRKSLNRKYFNFIQMEDEYQKWVYHPIVEIFNRLLKPIDLTDPYESRTENREGKILFLMECDHIEELVRYMEKNEIKEAFLYCISTEELEKIQIKQRHDSFFNSI